MSTKKKYDQLAELVSGLPEVYQPVFGHPKLSGKVSRPCCDRLQDIVKVHDALQKIIGRPLRVLDLGCAQGFFGFSLAERGAVVHGVDYLDKNIAVCLALAEEHPNFQVSFESRRVEDVIARLGKDQYDLILGLSVFHHIIHEKGVGSVKTLLNHAIECSGALIIETALREEPLYWAPAQPQESRSLLENIAFVHELARHETHLAPIPRPLYVASNRYWVLGEHAGRFESWTVDPHAFARGTHEGSRRYFFSPDYVVKIYRFDHQRGVHNRTEFTRETEFLGNPPADFTTPAFISGSNDTEGWVVLERKRGRLLLDMLLEGAELDRMAILRAVLGQLAVLEASGLYHNDVRTWNILVVEDGTVLLIDLGSISKQENDCVWPENRFLSFFIFVHELATGVIDQPEPLRNVAITPYSLPQPYREWGIALWKQPFRDWSFNKMQKALDSLPKRSKKSELELPADAWMGAIETAIQSQNQFMQHLKTRIAASEHWPEDLLKVLERTEAGFLKAASRVQQIEAEAGTRILKIEEKAEARAQKLQSELDAVRAQLEGEVAALASREVTLTEQQAHNQWLEKEWTAAKEKLEVHNLAFQKTLAEERAHTRQMENERNADRLKTVELNQALKEMLIRRHEAQIAAGKAESCVQKLQSELNAAQTQLGEKITTLASREATLAEQQAHGQRLENEWNAAKIKIEELNQAFQETLARQHEAQIATIEVEARAQKLQSELNEARTNAEGLNAQWSETLAALLNREATLADEKARSQWLENEWNAAKAKITELNQTSHHWWTVSTSLNRELQSVYHSKSWRITWPLRKLTQFFKWLGFLPVRLTRRLVCLPKRAVRWLLVKTIAFVLGHPAVKVRAKAWLCRHPGLENRLRRFTAAKGLVNEPPAGPSVLSVPAAARQEGNEFAAPDPDLSHLTPRARQIHAGLKAAIAHRRKGTC